MNEIILQLIVFLHILFILFIVITPFTNITYLLTIHAIIVPFMMLHWVTNNNTCALTIAEKHVRNQLYGPSNSEDCFTCRLIEPVYDFTNDKGSLSLFIYLVTIALWLVTIYKLYSKFQTGEIKSWLDLAR
jgi:hypothetical protein